MSEPVHKGRLSYLDNERLQQQLRLLEQRNREVTVILADVGALHISSDYWVPGSAGRWSAAWVVSIVLLLLVSGMVAVVVLESQHHLSTARLHLKLSAAEHQETKKRLRDVEEEEEHLRAGATGSSVAATSGVVLKSEILLKVGKAACMVRMADQGAAVQDALEQMIIDLEDWRPDTLATLALGQVHAAIGTLRQYCRGLVKLPERALEQREGR